MNFKMIVYLLGNILRVEGLLMLVPVIAAVCFLEKTAATALIASAGLCLIIGTAIGSREPENKRIYGRRPVGIGCCSR